MQILTLCDLLIYFNAIKFLPSQFSTSQYSKPISQTESKKEVLHLTHIILQHFQLVWFLDLHKEKILNAILNEINFMEWQQSAQLMITEVLTGLSKIPSWRHKIASLTKRDTKRSCRSSTDFEPLGSNLYFDKISNVPGFTSRFLLAPSYTKQPLDDFRPVKHKLAVSCTCVKPATKASLLYKFV
jgi:hypothetical protein